MSTILKALRRLERELRERVATGGAEPEERRRWPAGRLRLAALAAGAVALLAGAWYLGRSSADEDDRALARARPFASRRPAPMPPRALSWRPAAEHRETEAPSPVVEPTSREPELVAAPPEEPDFAIIERLGFERLDETSPQARKPGGRASGKDWARSELKANEGGPPPDGPGAHAHQPCQVIAVAATAKASRNPRSSARAPGRSGARPAASASAPGNKAGSR